MVLGRVCAVYMIMIKQYGAGLDDVLMVIIYASLDVLLITFASNGMASGLTKNGC